MMSQPLEPFNLKHSPKSLLDVLQYRAEHQPEQIAYTFLIDGEREEISLTYAELNQRVNRLACYLSTLVAAGERALLLYPPGLDYIIAFFACLRSCIIAVPAYPPRPNKSIARLQEIVRDAQPKLALTTEAVLLKAKDLFTQILSSDPLHCIATDVSHPGSVDGWEAPKIDREMLAFLQYTSGSTGTPKGVMITHGNILHNSGLIYNAFKHRSQSKGLIWLPPYHDMGLIGDGASCGTDKPYERGVIGLVLTHPTRSLIAALFGKIMLKNVNNLFQPLMSICFISKDPVRVGC